MDEQTDKKSMAERAGEAGREVIEEVGQVVDEIVAEAPSLWEKTKRAAGGAAAEVQEKGPGLWEHVKSVASETAEAFDRGLSGEDETESDLARARPEEDAPPEDERAGG